MPSPQPLPPGKSDESPKQPRRIFPSLTPGNVLLGLVVAAFLALLGYYFLPRKDLAEIARLKEKVIGLAENWESAEADEVLLQLDKLVPNNPFILRNLAVVRLNRFDRQNDEQAPENKDTPQQPPLPPAQLAAAIHALLQAEPNDAASHVLA
ncbi:MAG: hypothetical protein IAF94_14625, partial [Pirellulaceae bacterium]|nr:hypothetical protein [Pirellulaceae bacterium]